MNTLKRRLHDDLATRDAARAVVDLDVAYIKADVKRQGVGSRLADFATENGRVAADNAADLARDNKATVAGGAGVLLAGLLAWLFGGSILDAVDEYLSGEHDEDQDTDPEQDASRNI